MEGQLNSTKGNIYPGTNLTLKCNPPGNNSINWTLNNNMLQLSSHYVINNNELTVMNAAPSDSGTSDRILLYLHLTSLQSLVY